MLAAGRASNELRRSDCNWRMAGGRLGAFEATETLAQFASGATAGLLADGILHPVDTVRTRLWMQGTSMNGPTYHYTGVTQAVSSMLRQEGVAALFKGFGSVALFTPLGSGLYFVSYELVKKELERDFCGPRYLNVSPTYSPVLAAILGTAIGTLAWTPMDVIKQHQQASVGQVYNSVFDGLRRVYQQRGVQRGLLKGYWSRWLGASCR